MSKFFKCFPCAPSKKQTSPNTNVSNDQEMVIWPEGRRYTTRQISKAVAVVLSGFNSQAAADSLDVDCDTTTVDFWVQRYRPPFFQDGMSCPPALILWWMNELDRQERIIQNQNTVAMQQDPQQFQQQLLLYGPSYLTNQQRLLCQQSTIPQQSISSTYGTPYNQLPFIVNPNTTTTTSTQSQQPTNNTTLIGQGQGQTNNTPGTNTLIISSPDASQPNIRVIYQDDPKRPSSATTGLYNNINSIGNGGGGSSNLPKQPQRMSTSTLQQIPTPLNYEPLGMTLQQRIANTSSYQRQLQQSPQFTQQDSNLPIQIQGQGGQSRPSRGNGPPYTMIN